MERLVQVIPVILYHGKETWKVRRFSDYFEGTDEIFCRFVPEFEYLPTDLSGYSNEEIKDKVFRRTSLQIAMLLMRNIFDEKHLEDNREAVFSGGRGVKVFRECNQIFIQCAGNPGRRVVETVKEISEEGDRLSMTIAAKLIEKGKMEGKLEGKTEGERNALLLHEQFEILNVKFSMVIMEKVKRENNRGRNKTIKTVSTVQK
ncbi:MAG: Rpn family recombination-promoting nuclease/putative transposase [Candidatus Kuenenia sp.]|nr:Rpn family recombination-promoting nuclease/putative transposase [Candidatus Kuenenia hertensis]